jgi:fructosamine-3-kinase
VAPHFLGAGRPSRTLHGDEIQSLDLAKTQSYSIHGDEAKLSGFLDGYGPLPHDWTDRVRLYRLYHALELWDWFASIGNVSPLPSITEDIRALTAT